MARAMAADIVCFPVFAGPVPFGPLIEAVGQAGNGVSAIAPGRAGGPQMESRQR